MFLEPWFLSTFLSALSKRQIRAKTPSLFPRQRLARAATTPIECTNKRANASYPPFKKSRAFDARASRGNLPAGELFVMSVGDRPFGRVGIMGAGAWGTALAAMALRAESAVLLWAYEASLIKPLSERGENPLYLPGVKLPAPLSATSSLERLAEEEIIFLVSPAQALRGLLMALRPHYRGSPLILCSKGLEVKSGKFLSETAEEILGPAPFAVLSGPSFAHEVARDLPAALEIASASASLSARFRQRFHRPNFRLYPSEDILGAQLGGAVKNVLAIACGVVEGLGLGENARAAVITRGFAEMLRLGDALGASRESLCGLSGLGDLLLTCGSSSSRNMSLGLALGRGKSLEEALAEAPSVREGVLGAPALLRRARMVGAEMPLCESVGLVLSGEKTVGESVEAILSRPPREAGGAF